MKCKDCGLFGCARRGDGETECFYELEMKRQKEAEEEPYWREFRAEAAKDILCAAMSNPNSINDNLIDIVRKSINLADELIKQLKEKEEK